jgi:hypothetical protein
MTKLPQTEEESQQFFRDLLILASIPCDLIADFATRLEAEKSFFPFKEVLLEHIPEEAADSVARIVINLEPDSLPMVEEMVDRLVDDTELQLIDAVGVSSFKQNLHRLTQPSIRAVVRRLRKANDLTTATGNNLTGLTFICDARPVYNDDRTDIDGFVPLATMKIFYDDKNGEQDVIEITMSANDLDSFLDRASKAREKLNVMRQKFSTFLPDAAGGE